MTSAALRRVAFGVAPAVLAVGAVAGCNNDSAPTVQAPATTAPVQSTDSSTYGVPTVQPTDSGDSSSSSSSDTSVPTVTEAPTNSIGGDPSKVCTDDDSSLITPGVLAPSTKKAKWGAPLTLKQKYAGVVSLTAQKPVPKKPADDDFFAPDDGQIYLLIKVTAKYKSGDSTFLGDSYFTLRDSKKNACDRDLLGNVVQKRQRFDSVTIDKSTKTYTGQLVYKVPAGQNYSKYVLMYLPDSFDNKSADAPVAWTD